MVGDNTSVGSLKVYVIDFYLPFNILMKVFYFNLLSTCLQSHSQFLCSLIT